ncbi:MAG: ATP-binding protein, partial [Actinomycetota bacterium]|nr:ATP-binding protein [Actinomycetota bacterium]
QDPKDALNEFVSNAADEYAEAGTRSKRIRIVLRRRGRYPIIAVEDDGRGMDADRLREIARNLFNSSKASDPRTIGEKAIGILAFQQLGGRCDIVTRPAGSSPSFTLRLERGSSRAELDTNERRRARDLPGTTVYISDLDPDVLRVLTLHKVVDYLRRRRGHALARGDYQIEVVEGRRSELVTPEEPEGVRLDIPARATLWGRMEFRLYVAARPDRRRRVAVVGAGGTTIIDDLAEIEEFDQEPWSSDQVSGLIAFDVLRQSAGRRAVLRDREAFPVFVDAVRSVEPAVSRTLERVAREIDIDAAGRLNETVRRIFSRVLKELDDLDNPMRTAIGSEPGHGVLLREDSAIEHARGAEAPVADPHPELPSIAELVPPPRSEAASEPPGEARPSPGRSKSLPTLLPDPSPDGVRSRFDPDAGIVYYNDRHSDYLLLKGDERALLDYLATLVAKEYVVYNNPRAASDELAEEMVRMVVRVRRHLPKV